MSTNTKRILVVMTMVMAIMGLGEKAYSLQYPHNSLGGITSCNDCHTRARFKLLTSFDMLCFNLAGCHKPAGIASKKQLSRLDASDRFGNISVLQRGLSGKKNSSHGWKIPNVNASAGVTAQNNLGQSAGMYTKNIYCTRCHRAMGGTGNAKFLRKEPRGNYICFQCHSARQWDNMNVRDSLPAGKHYSHAVGMNYSSARQNKGSDKDLWFETLPALPAGAGYNESARPRLYTSYAGQAGAVVCQSCHGPIHSADSNPYTFDNLSAWSRGVTNYSSSAGNLLRMYPIAGPKASNNLCKSCHKVQAHRGYMCSRCHTPHKKSGESNIYLIQQTISTPSSGKRPVQFTSTSNMAYRSGTIGGYSTSGTRSEGICQVCHRNTKFHRSYSTPAAPRETAIMSEYLGNGKYKMCTTCHSHTDAFSPGGAACATCHKSPPDDMIGATVITRHAKHVLDRYGNPVSVNYNWNTGELTDARSADAYGFSCGRCHSPWAPYTASADSSGRHRPANWPGDSVSRGYTTEIGFNIRSDQPLPKNPTNASYNFDFGARGPGDPGNNDDGGSRFSTPGSGGGTCNNLYCHGQWYNGYTSNNPKFTGSQPCGSCHGAKPNNPPGKTGGVNYGAHPRHVGNANNQQYGSGAANFRCNACHNRTVSTSITSIDDRSIHVNGRVEIAFNQGGSYYPGDANSNYNGLTYNNATSRKPQMTPWASSRPAYKTCGLIYCHSDGSRTQGNYSVPFNAGIGSGTGKYPNWSSSSTPNGSFTTFGGTNTKRRCYRCHGNSTYKGITAAMPGYTSLRSGPGGKGNSHKKHVIVNGFLCNVCHSLTVNPDNKSIADTTKHVNKSYDIKILRSYSGVYDSTTHTCSMVSCHGRKTTPVWGNAAICQNCHMSNTGDNDKRILNQAFQNFSEAAPRIYTGGAPGNGWTDRGHGRPVSSGNYYGKDSYGIDNGNLPAGKTCTTCHKASVKHGAQNNPFRLYTVNSITYNPNTLCEDCHGLNPRGDGQEAQGSKAKGIQTHASSVTKTGRYNFAIKCVDCHDPHGDNNVLMLHSTIGRPKITSGTRREASDAYGRRLTNVTGYNVDFVGNQYSSNYARKYKAPRICQVCHTQTKNPTDLSKGGRFRWYSTGDKPHGSNKCTNCHTHASGFKGAGCDGCHGFPPTSAFTMISLQTGAKGKRASSSTTAGAHGKHTSIFGGTPTTCSKCHYSGMWGTGTESDDIDLEFIAFREVNPNSNYTGASQKYYGQTAVQGGFYGYSGKGAGAADNTYRCDVKCHGAKGKWLTSEFDTNTAGPRWNDPSTAKCGKCHGAKKAQGQGSWPTSNRHKKHAGTSGYGYDFMCRLCHSATVMDTATTLDKTKHVNGEATFKFYTGTFTGNRVWSQSIYTGGNTVVNSSGFGRCQNIYCHSRGTTTSPPYTGTAFPNYTAKWDLDISGWNAGERCSLCHGSKAYKGITSAMPNQSNQAHRKHVVDNGLKCNFCHSATVSGSNAIVSTTNHVNKFKNISIVATFRQGQTMYSSSPSTNKTCKNVRCHAGRKTPNWTVAYGTINCPDCHYSTTEDTDNFTFNSFSGTAARIYSTEWAKRGHGRPANGVYPFSNNSGAGRTCTNCHKPAAKHGASNNYFRLWTSNPDRLCLNCHGKTSDGLGSMVADMGAISNITGIQSHTWNNISTAGYKGGKIKAADRGGWNFGEHDSTDKKKVKCVDCHDPHGDKNNYMIHTYPNYSGSDRMGRPAYNNVPYNITTNVTQMTFSTVGGPQMNWSSYVKPLSGALGICQRCHSEMLRGTTSIMDNFNKKKYSNHNRTNRCTKCHKHKEGFKPSGCDGCHGYPPPNGPPLPNPWNENESNAATVGLHTPHAKNPNNRPGIIAENDVTAGAGFKCNKCHYNSSDGRSPDMGENPTKYNANMQQLTSVYGKWGKGADGTSSVVDDTCSRIICHTPRSFTRTWKKPSNCNGCHGFQNKTSLAFSLQTTGSHKAHIHYTSQNDYKRRKYGFRCTMCHVQNWPNFSTHYSGRVNMNFRYGLSTTAVYNRLGNTTSFKGWTTGGELATCSKVYCHGRFVNGTTITQPKWGNKLTGCSNCHKSKANATNMPGAHPLHVRPVASGYEFVCSRCHARTVVQNTISTLMFNYSSHVNGRKDIYFDTFNNNDGGALNSAKKCKNTYCHSSGYRPAPAGSFTTRTTLSNWTAYWYDGNRNAKTGNRPCSYCHGNKIYNGITAAMPNQTSLWGNSHRTHAIRNNFRCQICHSATLKANGFINISGGNHVNGFKNITIIAAYKQGQTLYSSQVPGTNKTCKNVRCHAGKKTPKWGTYIKCQDCHLSSTGDTDKRISANNTFQNFTESAPRIYSAAWAKTGHGRQSAYSSGNLAANKICSNCHKAAVAHGTQGNPFRLYTINSVNGNPNTLCEDCHGLNPRGDGQAAVGSRARGIQTHASSVTQTGRHNFAIKCVDCHDPHGDNNARFMVHSTVASPRITGTRAEISNGRGSIFWNATGRNVDFNQNAYTSNYAKKVKADRICQVCHTRTFKPGSSAVTRFRRYSSKDLSHGVGPCTNCHSHSQGFKGAACNSCHGFPPASANTLIGRPGTNQIKTMSGSTTAGAHLKHVNVFGSSNDTCNKCHSGGMAFDSKENDDITLKFDAFNRYTGVNQKYQGQTGTRNGYYGYSGVGIAAPGANNLTCSNMKCHGAKGNWLTKSFGTPSSPVWNSPNSVFCGSCHGAKKEAGAGSYPTTNAHKKHAGWATGEYDFQCRLCHSLTVTTANYTTLDDLTHVNAESKVDFSASNDQFNRVDNNSAYSGDLAVNSTFGRCTSLYCHSKGTDRVAPYNNATAFATFTAYWPDTRGGYKKPNGQAAKCNYCHGNKSWSGVTSAMPNYPNDSPKANKHPKHVGTYNFLCANCHVGTTRNNTSIDGTVGLTNHVNRKYDVKFGDQNYNTRQIDNSLGSYTSTNSSCKGIYCHSRGVDLEAPFNTLTALANYTAHWSDNRGGYKKANNQMAKCNYCHGSRNTYSGMTSAMPNYASGSPKANRHPMHVARYGFSCTVCHDRVTANSTSIDAVGGSDRHVNKIYNIDFNKDVPGRSFINNTGAYTYLNNGQGSKCKNTYCHSRGTDFVKPYNTRTSFANWTARWGDDRGSYKQAKGLKAKCNYCHGNRLFSGITAAMPNYSSQAFKANKHPKHVRTYGFLCTSCHVNVTINSTSIDAAGGTGLHVNRTYNVNFNSNTRTIDNSMGTYSSAGGGIRCKNIYCHSRGTKTSSPYTNRTALPNYTANWNLLNAEARTGTGKGCSFCHGNKTYAGITSAMPNYTGTAYGGPKVNSHRKHVVENGFRCYYCHSATINSANNGIADTNNHVNKFINVTIIAAYKQGQTMYSSSLSSTNKTCKNVRCHAGKTTPKWGSKIICQNCHLSTTGDVDKRISLKNPAFQNFSRTAPRIYSTAWADTGHGRNTGFYGSGNSGAAKTCTDCHGAGETRAGGLETKHGTPNNPFRWITAPNRPNMVCNRCHGPGGSGSTKTGILMHASSVTATGRHNFAMKCIDCHDPHGDNNLFMFHSTIPRYVPGAGKKEVSNTNGQVLSNITVANLDFSQNQYSSDYARKFKAAKVCQVCHRRTADPSTQESRFRWYSAKDKAHGVDKCTATCHQHTAGFKGGGESSGNTNCNTSGCHGGTNTLFDNMRNTNNYHHVMINASATGSPKYPNVSAFGPTDRNNPARRCLMCHVDHNIFRPDINSDGTGGRSRNLRWSVLAQGNKTGINTDFWPAKRKNQVRSGSDSGTANYSSTYPVSGPTQYNGICISCHKNVQYKNTTLVNQFNVSRARPFPVSLYTSSSHNFQVISGTFGFSGDGSNFRGNCTKCHRTPNPKNDFTSLSKPNAQDGRFPVALHDKNVPSLMMNIATSSFKPKIEQLCYNCHSQTPRSAGGPGTIYDYYSSVKMNSGAKLLRMGIEGKPTSGHPIDDADMAGNHKIDEGYRVPKSYNYGRSGDEGGPGSGWNRNNGKYPGRHVECVDCHNTHGGNASLLRRLGTNEISGAQKGVWGVKYKYTSSKGSQAQPTYSTIEQVTMQYELCLKCHSAFGYYTALPSAPSGAPARSTSFGEWDYEAPETDVGMDFSPNAHGYHPVIAQGRNQPPITANANWPAGSTMRYYDYQDEQIKFAGRSGFDYNFVPPFGRKATLACSDCHRADTSGNAAGAADTFTVYSASGWTGGAAELSVYNDGNYAQPNAGTQMTLGVFVKKANEESAALDSAEVVLYGKSSSGTKNDRAIIVSAKRLGVVVNIDGAATKTLSLTGSNLRYVGLLASNPTWAELTGGITWQVEAKKSTTGTPEMMFIDYVGIAGMYKTTGVLRGPHGSLQRWILVDLDRKGVRFDSDRNGTIGNTKWDVPNSTYPTDYSTYGGTVAGFIKHFCFNCHRRDVYGAESNTADTFKTAPPATMPNGRYSRIVHPLEGKAADAALNAVGIWCLNCHGGRVYNNVAGGTGDQATRRMNNLHGSFSNRTVYNKDLSGFEAVINRPKGVRLLNGAMNSAVEVSSTYTVSGTVYVGTVSCYTQGTADSMGNCSAGTQTGVAVWFNYNYTSW